MPFRDHFSIGVSDLARSGAFYDALLATIGASRRFEKPDFICYAASSAEFFVVNAPDDKLRPIAPSNGFHVCFTAPDDPGRSEPGVLETGPALSRRHRVADRSEPGDAHPGVHCRPFRSSLRRDNPA